MKAFSQVQIHVQADSGAHGTLNFRLRNHSAAQRWAHCLERASQQSQLLERDRWYNFPRHKYETAEKITEQLNQTILKINKVHPGLITQAVDPQRLQQSINALHVHFADNHLISRQITEESAVSWREFNNHLHAFEAWERHEQVKTLTGRNETCSIVFTWADPQKQPLQDEDYAHFTTAKKFGTCYVNYCQVGRHFYELFQSQDTDVKDEHILPLRLLSADTYIWFGSTTGPQNLQKRNRAIESWFQQHQERFRRLGHIWGDPKLAIGWLPVADFETSVNSPEGREEFINWLSQFKEISGCRCL